MDAAKTGTVLVVDDDDDFRDALVMILLRHGYQAVQAASGTEALMRLQANAPPCVVLVDLMMPVMNGFELFLRMREDPRLVSIPVVVLTGAPTLEKRARNEMGVQVLHKPLVTTQLLGVIDRFCAGSPPAA